MTKFLSTCRCCAIEANGLTNLFTNIDGSLKIAEILGLCSNLIISPSDQRPQQICQTCRLDLWKAYSFRKKCQHSEIFFRFQLPASTPTMPEIDETNDTSKISSRNDCNSINVISNSKTNSDQFLPTVIDNNLQCKEEIIVETDAESIDMQNIECKEEFLELESIHVEPTTENELQQHKPKPKSEKEKYIAKRSSQKRLAIKSKRKKPVASSKKSLICETCRKY